MAAGTNSCIKLVAYLLVFGNIMGGILNLVEVPFEDDYYSISSQPSGLNQGFCLVQGIISIWLGLLLLYAVVKKNATCVLLYLGLMCIDAIIRTGHFIYILVTLVSALGWFTVRYTVFLSRVILWHTIYFLLHIHSVYLFYKLLLEEQSTYVSNLNRFT